jgi:hypothetical protein
MRRDNPLSDTLYIIGNGFDLHHGIQSSYRTFGQYLKALDHRTYEVVERHFDVNAEFWAEFEDGLAHFDSDTLIQDATNSLVSYGAENWRDAHHHDYQYEIKQAVDAISKTLRARFGDWIRQLRIPESSEIANVSVPIDPSATFLNFNYIASLQRLYNVPEKNILHIHGAASDPNALLVLGHGRKPDDIPRPYRVSSDPEDADTRVVEGQALIDSYFKDTFKPTRQIIRNNETFFRDLATVENVLVMGHSVSEVDHPYFREVIRNIDASRVRWKISYFGDLTSLRGRIDHLGIDARLVEYALLAEF